ncbi:MAG: hypothetical protein HC889_15500 [Synechococcaceae cyanobacterium SM1_2_3]|nr:hypothetical protein [Synechococcaceae cyanobacterium SM1_2_3]
MELPLPLSPDGRLALAALVERDHRTNVGWQLHLGKSYDFSGPITATSYDQIAAHNRFAFRGILEADYPETIPTIDEVTGIEVRLSGPDLILPEQSPFSATADELLVFVGDEILSVFGWQLLGVGRYRLFVMRARLTSELESHVVGADVYVISRDDLLALAPPQVQVGNQLTFKLTKVSTGAAQSLADSTAVTHTVTGVMLFQLAPANLRVNGQNRNAVYSAGQDIRIDWSLPAARAEVASLNAAKFRTLVELVSIVSAEVLYSKITSDSTLKIPTAKMAAILGAETDFVVRVATDGLATDFSFQSAALSLTVTQL